LVYWLVAAGFVAIGLYHLVVLPKPDGDHAVKDDRQLVGGFFGFSRRFSGRRTSRRFLASCCCIGLQKLSYCRS
jgi:hypothetical protein